MGFFSWLAAKFSRSQMLEPVAAVEPPPLYFQHTRIGGALTPEDVSSILRDVDAGYLYRYVDLFNESRQKDCHLQCALSTRELAVAGMRWQVTPASEDKLDVKVADFCRDWLTNFGTRPAKDDEEEPKDLRHLVSHLAGGVSFGYSFAETLFARDGGYVVPTGAVPISHRRFVYELTRGRLQFWDMSGTLPYPGIDLMAEYPGRFVLHTPRINGDVQAREGLGRVLIWAALFRSWSIADWMKLAELAWKPWRIGYYEKGGAKEDKQALVRALQFLTTNGVAYLPKTVSLDIEWAKSKGDAQHGAMASFLGAEMSKAILGATLTVEQGKNGARALGEVHNEVRHDIRDADAMAIAASIRRTLIAPAVRLNFGANVAIPGFSLYAEKQVDLVQLSLAVLNMANAGLAVPAQWARDLAGIPTPKEGEEIIGGGMPLPTAKAVEAMRAFLIDAERRGLLLPASNDARPVAA